MMDVNKNPFVDENEVDFENVRVRKSDRYEVLEALIIVYLVDAPLHYFQRDGYFIIHECKEILLRKSRILRTWENHNSCIILYD